MSMTKNYYVIEGYDLTEYKTDKYYDWEDTDEAEDYVCNKVVDEIQFFDDPMSGSFLCFGYILAAGDDYYFDTVEFDISDLGKHFKDVSSEIKKFQEIGIIEKDINIKPKIIVFEESH